MASSRLALHKRSRSSNGVPRRSVSSPSQTGKTTFNYLNRVPVPQDVPDRAPSEWSLDKLSGRFVEISSWGHVSITAAGSLLLEAQLRAEPVAWVAVGDSTFFPPDFAKSGIDLDALPVIRVPNALSACRVADPLLRSGGFGVMVIDLGRDLEMRMALQVRLAALAKKHRTALFCLTQKEPAVPSLGPLVSLRVQGEIKKTGFNRFTWALNILRDKHQGVGWQHSEVCCGPDGLC